MPNVFREQAQDRFTRSLAFLTKADTLLQDDLVNRSALADAVSAIKNMLQGYLLLCISHTQTPETADTQRWQEIAAGNSMPDLLQACGEAGLDLRGLAVEIKALNRERNRRMHDDPGQRIETQQARQALDLARNVQRRIRAAVRGAAVAAGPDPTQSTPARIAAVARAAVSGQLGRAATRPAEAAPVPADVHAGSQPDPAPAEIATTYRSQAAAMPNSAETGASLEAAAGASSEDVEALVPDETDGANGSASSGDTQLLAALTSSAPEHRRNRAGRAIVRVLLAVALLLIGVIGGAALMFPVATGRAPGWLTFATQFLPATPTATAIPTTPAAPSPTPSGPFIAGAFVVVPSCSAGNAAVTLTNTGTQPVRWSIGSPDGAGVMFALPGGGSAAPSQSGTLKGGASVTISVSGTSSGADTLVVVASTGTVQLPAPTC